MHKKAYCGCPVSLLITMLVFFLSLPAVIGFVWNDTAALEQLENRHMAPFPKWSLYPQHPDQFIMGVEHYLKDRVGLRRKANQLYRKLRYFLLKDPPMANIAIGQDGFVFMNSHREDRPDFIFQLLCEQQVDPDPALIAEMDRTFANFSGYYSARGPKVTIAAAPTNVALYADKLPRTVDRKYREACQAYPENDHLLAQLERMGRAGDRYSLYYPLALFQAHRDEPYFYPKEKWHWTGRSAYLFARDLLRFSGVVDRLLLDDPAEIGSVGDDLMMFFGFSRQVRGLIYPYAEFETTMERPKWAASLSREGGLLRFTTKPGLSGKRGLLISNSFGIDLAPHLAKGFSELYFYNLNKLNKEEEKKLFTQIIDKTKPDYIYLLFDDAGIIAAPKRLEFFNQMDIPQSTVNEADRMRP